MLKQQSTSAPSFRTALLTGVFAAAAVITVVHSESVEAAHWETDGAQVCSGPADDCLVIDIADVEPPVACTNSDKVYRSYAELVDMYRRFQLYPEAEAEACEIAGFWACSDC
jgi:hypothetical protein